MSARGAITVGFLIGAMAVSNSALAGEIRLSLQNDFLTTNSVDDDLYTSGIGLSYSLGRYELGFTEIAFTDSGHDRRFDETYFSGARLFHPIRGWHPRASVGILRVGRGLFGESVQNAVHDLIRDERVVLGYVDQTEFYPTLAFELRREFWPRPRLEIVSRGAVESSVGFKSGLELSAGAVWRPFANAWFGVEVGGRYTNTSFPALEPWIEEAGPLWELAVGLPRNVVLAWRYNEFGTRLQHFTLRCHWHVGRDRERGRLDAGQSGR